MRPIFSATPVAGRYAMFFGGLLMLGARLGDRFGHRRTITASLAVLALGGLLGAVANSVVLLAAARCLQGAAAAVPSALRLLTTLTTEGPRRQRAVAAWSAAGASAGASGFVIRRGGHRRDQLAPGLLGLPAAGCAARGCRCALCPLRPPPPPRRAAERRRAAVFTAAVMATVAGAALIAQPGRRAAGLAVVALAAPLTAGFIRIDRRAAAPLLPPAVVRIPTLCRGTLGVFLNTAATSSAMTLATLYLQDTLHHSSLTAAAMLVPSASPWWPARPWPRPRSTTSAPAGNGERTGHHRRS